MATELSDEQFRAALGRFATGVTVITAGDQDWQHGMTATAFSSISLHPPLVMVALSNSSRMYRAIRRYGRFGVNVLAREQQTLSLRFSGSNSEGEVRFDWLDGVPTIDGALVRLSCDLDGEHAAGDHTICIGRLTHIDWRAGDPLIYYNGSYQEVAGLTAS